MSIMDINFGINLSAYGEPVVEQEIDAPWVGKGHREVKINLPLGYERLNYKLFFIDIENDNIIGPFFNGQVVNLSSFSGRIKVKAILDKEYSVSFRGAIEIPMNACGKYVPFKISYDYEGLLDIDFNSLALCKEQFTSENSLLLRAKNNMETALRIIISQLIDQNRTPDGNIVANLFYSLETRINLAIHENFNEICNDYISWCKPVGNLKITNENMNEVIQVINEPLEIARSIEMRGLEHNLQMREIALQGAIENQKEAYKALGAIGSTGTMSPDQLCELNTSFQASSGFSTLINGTLNLGTNNNNLGLNLAMNSEIPALNYLKEKK